MVADPASGTPLPDPDETVRRGLRILARLGPPPAAGVNAVLRVAFAEIRLEKQIGRGTSGEVWLAQDLTLQRRVAVKILWPQTQGDARQRARLENEALALARLQNSPAADQVVKIHSRGETADGRQLLVLEFIEGGSLADRLLDERNLPRALAPQEAACLVEQLARTVAVLHDGGLIHRDLKPSNVLLTPTGQPKLADFGLARSSTEVERLTSSAEILGTPQYMAPEQAGGRNEQIAPAADVYALGAILYECLTGRPPFLGENPLDTLIQVRTRDPVPLSDLTKKVPRDLQTICLKCLQKKPGGRYTRALDLAEDLRRFLSGKPIVARPPGPLERGWKLARRNPAWAAALVIFAVGFLVAAVLAGVAKQEAARAERNAALRLAALDDVLSTISGERLRRAGQTRLMHELLERLAPRFEEVLALGDQDDATRAQQGLAWNSLAVIHRAMNKDKEALESAGRAESIFRELTRGRAPSASNRLGLASALSHMGLVLGQGGKLDDAAGKLDEASGLIAGLLQERGEDAFLRYKLALAHNNWANCLMRNNDGEGADAHYREAIGHIDAATRAHPAEALYRDWHARALSNLALLCDKRKQPEEARRFSREAVAIARRLAADFPGEIDGRECLAVCLSNEGELVLNGGDLVASLPLFREALVLYEGLARQVPAYVEFPWGRAMAESNLGAALADGPPEGWDEAETLLRHADELYQELIKANPGNQELQVYIDENRDRLRKLGQKRVPSR
jgi:serine/threonine-protein kinase